MRPWLWFIILRFFSIHKKICSTAFNTGGVGWQRWSVLTRSELWEERAASVPNRALSFSPHATLGSTWRLCQYVLILHPNSGCRQTCIHAWLLFETWPPVQATSCVLTQRSDCRCFGGGWWLVWFLGMHLHCKTFGNHLCWYISVLVLLAVWKSKYCCYDQQPMIRYNVHASELWAQAKTLSGVRDFVQLSRVLMARRFMLIVQLWTSLDRLP